MRVSDSSIYSSKVPREASDTVQALYHAKDNPDHGSDDQKWNKYVNEVTKLQPVSARGADSGNGRQDSS